MEKLQLDVPLGDRKGQSTFSTFEDIGGAVEIFHRPVEVGGTQNVCIGNTGQECFLCVQLVGSIGSPVDVGAAGLFLGEGLEIRRRVDSTG